MGNTFEQINEIVDNLQLTIKEADHFALIEKDILLQKLRGIYAELAIPSAAIQPQPEPAKVQSEPVVITRPEYKVHEGVAEDVDLFFEMGDDSAAPEEPEESETIAEPKIIVESEVEEKPERIETPKAIEKPEVTPQPESVKMQPEPVEPKIDTIVMDEPQPEIVSESMPVKPAPARPKTVSDEDEILQFTFSGKKSKPAEKPVQAAQPKPAAQPKTTAAPQRSINDMFSEKSKDNSLGSQFQHAKVVDLTKSISVNDKFAFIKELFNNKGEEYSKAIQKLNQCTNIEAAFDCLESYKNKFFWDSTSNAYLTLCDLLRRKFQ